MRVTKSTVDMLRELGCQDASEAFEDSISDASMAHVHGEEGHTQFVSVGGEILATWLSEGI